MAMRFSFSSARETILIGGGSTKFGAHDCQGDVGECSISKFLPTITQDLSRRCIATSGVSVSTYPRRPKVEAFSNTVDVVERLHDPTDPSTERTAPPRSAHVQLDDVPRTLDPVEAEGEFRQHDGVVMVMMKLPTQGFA